MRLTLAPVAGGTLPVAAAGGRALAATDDRVGATLLRVVETPALDDQVPVAPRITVVAAGEGAAWRQAALLWSADDGASWTDAGPTGAPGIVGDVEQATAASPATLVDEAGVLVVRLATAAMALHDADDDALDRGGNLASVGGELIQFGRATPLGDRRWRLSRLWRGRRGSVVTPDDHDFVLLTGDAARVIDLPVAAVGREVRVMASGVGDDVPVEARIAVAGIGLRPPATVHLRVQADGDGATLLTWVRRSRAGWRWIDGVDVPLAEEAERYRVTLGAGAGAREIEVAEPRLRLPPGFDAGPVAVRQRGIWGESAAATLIMAGETA